MGAAGVAAVKEFTTTAGRQPSKDSVVPTRSVAAAVDVLVNLIVKGFLPLMMAAQKSG